MLLLLFIIPSHIVCLAFKSPPLKGSRVSLNTEATVQREADHSVPAVHVWIWSDFN